MAWRRRSIKIGKIRFALVEYPGWIDVLGHLGFKVVVPQICHALVCSAWETLVWICVATASAAIIVILLRELEHLLAPEKIHRRRFFLFRLGSSFARASLVIGFGLHVVYVLIFLTFISFGLHRLDPTSYAHVLCHPSALHE